MTICIAMKAANNVIVTASDMKITTGHYSTDVGVINVCDLHPDWYAMIAGKISMRIPFLQKIGQKLASEKIFTADMVADICTEEYIAYQRRLAYEKVLSPYNLTFDKFLQSAQTLGPTLFERLWSDIARIQVGFDLLVFGHDPGGRARIFIISSPTEDHPSFVTFCDDPHFGAIGSGSYIAEGILCTFGNLLAPIEVAIYDTVMAKFIAESASDVGHETYVRIFYPNREQKRLRTPFIDDDLRQEWERHGRPTMRPEALNAIRQQVQNMPPAVGWWQAEADGQEYTFNYRAEVDSPDLSGVQVFRATH